MFPMFGGSLNFAMARDFWYWAKGLVPQWDFQALAKTIALLMYR